MTFGKLIIRFIAIILAAVISLFIIRYLPAVVFGLVLYVLYRIYKISSKKLKDIYK